MFGTFRDQVRMAPKPSPDQIRAVASSQRLLLWAILVSLALIPVMGLRLDELARNSNLPPAVAEIVATAVLMLNLGGITLQIVAVVRVCRALGDWRTIYFALVMFIPCISFLTLLNLNSRASTRLQKAGIRVGMFGACQSDVDAYVLDARPTTCPNCGELISAEASTCPMCGAAV